ncbi:hypothetical protein [Streptomyces sp. CB01580]|uniref:hypothetical protein n=1 Tax=Streptomyces sp. CB01580 TaxID=1703933 RepID=UPI00093F7FA1|nr:hypothetical protein [Streptomyces sp. CB01580]OKJ32227.1 hypothetical protein AMK22_23340 [Streptomyces sp. CB01580]
MFHRIRTRLPRTLVQMALPVLARGLRAPASVTSVPARVFAPRVGATTRPHPPCNGGPLGLGPRTIDHERRARRTATRLALDGLVVVAGVGQAHSVGSLVLASARAVA